MLHIGYVVNCLNRFCCLCFRKFDVLLLSFGYIFQLLLTQESSCFRDYKGKTVIHCAAELVSMSYPQDIT